MIKKVFAISMLLGIVLYQGSAFASDNLSYDGKAEYAGCFTFSCMGGPPDSEELSLARC